VGVIAEDFDPVGQAQIYDRARKGSDPLQIDSTLALIGAGGSSGRGWRLQSAATSAIVRA
jgi:hypothetical protein